MSKVILSQAPQTEDASIEDQPEQRPIPVSNHLLRTGSLTVTLNTLILAINLVTGVLIARVLGPSGRGALTAVITAPVLIAWGFAMGCREAVSFEQARRPSQAGSLLSTWLLVMLPLVLLALLVSQIYVHIALGSSQSRLTVGVATVFTFLIVPIMLGELVYGLLLADEEFITYRLIGLAQPAMTAALDVAFWKMGKLDVRTAALAAGVPLILGLAFASERVIRRYGFGRPSLGVAKKTLSFGFRAHGTTVSDLLNTRLDLMIVPIFLSASAVGFYSVASNVAGIVINVASGLAIMVLPIGARHRSREAVVRLVQATALLALLIVVVGEFVIAPAVNLVYGSAFEASVPLIRVLLPGCGLYAVAAALRGGLYAANRPLSATVCYLAGAAITVLGLVLFLKSGGLMAAAIVSSVSYAVVLIATLGVFVIATRSQLPARRFVDESVPEVAL